MIIGLNGYATSGKDAVGRILVDQGLFDRYAFADEVKRALYTLNPAVGVNRQTGNVTYLKPFIDSLSGSFEEKWDTAKQLQEVRRLLQRLGTEVGREIFGEDLWVDVVFRKIVESGSDKHVVITDMRFPNEAQRVREVGGYTIRIHRPGVGPARDDKDHVHRSEIALDDWEFDFHLHNEGTLEDLHEDVKRLYLHIEEEDHTRETVDGD